MIIYYKSNIMNNNSRFFNNFSTNTNNNTNANFNTTNPSSNMNDINHINNNYFNNDNINSRQYISILYTIYNDNYRLINELRNDNLMLRNHIVNEYERSVNNENHMRFNNRRRAFSRTSVPPTPWPIYDNINAFYDRVPVPPSNEQIQLATLTTYYSNIVEPLNTNCPITLESFENNSVVTLIKYCGHIFKHESLNNWFAENNRCPVCRYDVRNYTANLDDNYEIIDSSNIVVDNNTTSDTENTTNESNSNSNTNTNTNNNNNNNRTNLRVNTEEELTNQIDNMLTQLFNNNNNSDSSGNFVITYTLQ